MAALAPFIERPQFASLRAVLRGPADLDRGVDLKALAKFGNMLLVHTDDFEIFNPATRYDDDSPKYSRIRGRRFAELKIAASRSRRRNQGYVWAVPSEATRAAGRRT